MLLHNGELTMESIQMKQRFLQEIRSTFDYGGLNCSLSERDLSDFHNFLENDFDCPLLGYSKQAVL